MTIVMKEKVNEFIAKICKQIEESGENSVKIDISSAFKKLYFSNIVHVLCGEDISD